MKASMWFHNAAAHGLTRRSSGVVRSLRKDDSLWLRAGSKDAREYALLMEPGAAIPASPERLDSICQAFAEVIDAKSPYTYNHSVGVARASVEITEGLGLSEHALTLIRRAALLHDLGKLSVSNAILEKPSALTAEEWKVMRMHPVYTRLILQTISGFEHLAFIAAAHHERLDGTGYPDGLAAEELPLAARIICVADTFQAITENRPYRHGSSREMALKIMDAHVPHALDADCVEVLRQGRHTHLVPARQNYRSRLSHDACRFSRRVEGRVSDVCAASSHSVLKIA